MTNSGPIIRIHHPIGYDVKGKLFRNIYVTIVALDAYFFLSTNAYLFWDDKLVPKKLKKCPITQKSFNMQTTKGNIFNFSSPNRRSKRRI